MHSFRKFLVPLDFGEPSKHALSLALELAAKFDATVTLFHVSSLPNAPYVEGLAWPILDFEQAARGALDEAVQDARTRYPKIDGVLAFGDTAHEVVEAVKKNEIDLVVMGTHGRRGVRRFLLGSVAEKVVRLSPVPVMTVAGD
ncbi:MAG: universal stress protein [Polyangiaceae bacterium]|nr:universal stress protein [Polyangiaceae bacterium]